MDHETRGKLAAMHVMILMLAANLPPSNRRRFAEVLKLSAERNTDSAGLSEFNRAYASTVEDVIAMLKTLETADA